MSSPNMRSQLVLIMAEGQDGIPTTKPDIEREEILQNSENAEKEQYLWSGGNCSSSARARRALFASELNAAKLKIEVL